MKIDWVQKWMVVPVSGVERKLQGIAANVTACEEISPKQLLNMMEQQAVLHCFLLSRPPEMQNLVAQFAEIFEEPKWRLQK